MTYFGFLIKIKQCTFKLLLAFTTKGIDNNIIICYIISIILWRDSMKTAISIPDDLFKAVKEMSKKLSISRSQLFARAARDYIAKQKNKELFETLNEVYSEVDTKQEVEIRKQSKKHYAKLLKTEKW